MNTDPHLIATLNTIAETLVAKGLLSPPDGDPDPYGPFIAVAYPLIAPLTHPPAPRPNRRIDRDY